MEFVLFLGAVILVPAIFWFLIFVITSSDNRKIFGGAIKEYWADFTKWLRSFKKPKP